jgi:hypothetical protein
MKKSRLIESLTISLFVVLLMVPPLVGADVFMKEKQHSDGMTFMGQTQPPQDKIITTWISKDQMRTDHGDISTIVRFKDDKVHAYHLNHAQKSVMEMSFDAEEMEGMGRHMAQNAKIKVTATGETKKIGSWNCTKYIQEMNMGMMPMTSEIWASEEIKIPYYEMYKKLSAGMAVQQPGMKAFMQSMEEETRKIKGVPVLTITNMTMMKNTNMKSSRELLEIKEDTAPSGIFEIPAGYTTQVMPGGPGERPRQGKQRQQ